MDRALEDFYEDAIFTAEKQTGVNERKIRTWCQQNLITKSGTRSMVHRGQGTSEGIENEVLDWLESKYLIRREWRSGASWYELTHDRLVTPMRNSNVKWKNANDRKKTRKVIITTALTAAVAAIIITTIVWSLIPQPSSPPTSINQHNVTVGNFPTSVAFNPDTGYMYVANAYSDSISAIPGGGENVTINRNANTDEEIEQQSIHVRDKPESVAVNPNTNMIYVANSDSDTVSVIDGSAHTVVRTIPVGDGPSSVAVNPKNTDTIYVTNAYHNTVSIIQEIRPK
jgi:YVTN family beta-propeller protein